MMSREAAAAVVREVFELFERARHQDYIGEPISQLEHSLQAAHFAVRAGAHEAAVLGALLHDIGHICAAPEAARMDALGVMDHESIGADYARARGFSDTVSTLIREHVAAKRYQVFKRSDYRASLSRASLGTLLFQGGPMSHQEARAFEAHPDFKTILAVRAWDELAKVPGLNVAALEHYREMMITHLTHATPSTHQIRPR